ncbi:hypothetical protein HDV05_008445 [Chytridiales sp. JEL 0842]|nr:hypothetical protein HDV05_008445 [Chytridiales sp. JEL 0842]
MESDSVRILRDAVFEMRNIDLDVGGKSDQKDPNLRERARLPLGRSAIDLSDLLSKAGQRECGLVALYLVAESYGLSLPEPHTALQSTSDSPPDPRTSPPSLQIAHLLSLSRLHSFTLLGEMFNAVNLSDLAKLAYKNNLSSTVEDWTSHTQITSHLEKGGFVLVAYDKDGNHEPCMKGGEKAHWAVINGL